MMNPFKRYRLRKDWRLVIIISAQYTTNGEVSGKLYYYLYENGLGKRKYESKGNGTASTHQSRVTHPVYMEQVYPWIQGAYDPEIPSYESIKAKEFKDALKGKKT